MKVKNRSFQETRAQVCERLENMRNAKHGALRSRGDAILDAQDFGGWQTTARARGAELYAELCDWAVLYHCDLNIEHLRTRGAEFSKTEAAVAEKIWDGMMEANQELIHLRRGEAPPSPHMIQEPPADTGDSGGGIRK